MSQLDAVILKFLSKRDQLDNSQPADSLIDKVIKINLFQEIQQNLEYICQELLWTLPSKEIIHSILLQITAEHPEEIKVKKQKARYFGVRIHDDVISYLNSSFEKLIDFEPIWKSMKASILPDKVFHVTLAVRNIHKSEYSFYDKKKNQIGTFIEGIRADKIVWDHNALAIQVTLPNNLQCGNEFPHITIATFNSSTPPSYSNDLLNSNPPTQFCPPGHSFSGTIESFI